MLKKAEIRKQIRKRLRAMPRDAYENRSRKIHDQLFQTLEWKHAKTVGVTVSIFPEVDTYGIIEKGWESGKQIAVPKCFPETRTMRFYVITNFDQLEKGYFGLYEPVIDEAEEIPKTAIDLLLVPGVGFTKQGFRLGMGGGYYDRFLTDFSGNTVSLCFTEQFLPTLPLEPHDRPVQKIITETTVFEAP